MELNQKVVEQNPSHHIDTLIKQDENLGIWDYEWSKLKYSGFVGENTLQFNIVKKFIEGKSSILDVGCGTGVWAEAFMRSGFQVEGIDFSPYAIKRCLEKGIKVYPLDLTRELPHKKYDIIYSSHLIEHLNARERLKFIENSYHALNTGGLFVAITPFNENVNENFVRCPTCSNEYHFQGHKEGFGEGKLSSELLINNFKVLFEKVIYPLPLTNKIPVSWSCLLLDKIRKRGFISPMTDIITIGQKADIKNSD